MSVTIEAYVDADEFEFEFGRVIEYQVELGLEVTRVSQTDRSTADPKEGLSDQQREALNLAI